MTEAEQERAAVVRWMKDIAASLEKDAAFKLSPLKYRANAEERATWFGDVANAIERGNHLGEKRG